MRKMFTLRGVGNCGKTSNIKNIASWIMNNYIHTNHGIDISKRDIYGIIEINKLKIGFVSAGDNLAEVLNNDKLINQFSDVDILINSCRTRGKGRRHLENNFSYLNGWLAKNIYLEKYSGTATSQISSRDERIFIELKTWLTGLEKL